MGKQNYREAIEKGRQEISVQSSTAATRRAYRKANAVKKKPGKRKNVLLPALFFMFILIPVSLLMYVVFWYEPNDTLTTSAVNDQVTLETTPPSSDKPLVPEEAEEEDQEKKAEEQAKEAAAKEKAAAEKAQAEKEKAEKAAAAAAAKEKAEAEAKAQAAAKAQEKAKAEAEAEAQAEAQAKAKADEKARAEAEAKKQQEQAAAKKEKEEQAEKKENASQKTHVVQAGETLYRIAVNTYGAAGANAGVEKIKQANGLSSNELTVGRTLVLP